MLFKNIALIVFSHSMKVVPMSKLQLSTSDVLLFPFYEYFYGPKNVQCCIFK